MPKVIWSTTCSCARESTTGRNVRGSAPSPCTPSRSAKDGSQRLGDGGDTSFEVTLGDDERGIEDDGEQVSRLGCPGDDAVLVHGMPDAHDGVRIDPLDVQLDAAEQADDRGADGARIRGGESLEPAP